MEESGNQLSDIKEKTMENNKGEKERGIKLLDHTYRLREISDSMNRNNIHIIRVPEEEWEKGAGLFEQIIAENFPNLQKETGIQTQEAKRTPLEINKTRSTL
ncbi:LORF1 protein, partial [Crocuta crocuta]